MGWPQPRARGAICLPGGEGLRQLPGRSGAGRGMLRASLNRGNICETTPKCVSGGDVTPGCGFSAQPGEAAPFSQLLPLFLFFPSQIVPLIFVLETWSEDSSPSSRSHPQHRSPHGFH